MTITTAPTVGTTAHTTVLGEPFTVVGGDADARLDLAVRLGDGKVRPVRVGPPGVVASLHQK